MRLPYRLLPLLWLSTPITKAADLSFNRDVRPILSDKCYYCHGTDPNHRKGERRLDTPEGAFTEKDGVRAVVPGKPDESDIIARIFTTDREELMPPAKSHKTLSETEKATIKRWVFEGAKYQPHWAFTTPKRAGVPDGSNPIDFFISKALTEQGLKFNTRELPGTLLRRVSLDLNGIPPTADELESFEKAAHQDFPKAYADVVDRLLQSPRFGERMAIEWLDAARYADTNGYQMDALRMNWPWRDWVIHAFNSNMPFDRFTTEQLAGDMLPNPTQDQLVATAFNRNHMLNAEGGTIAEENRTKNVFDRVETTGTTWLGLTMNCCQCHDHKFDPLKQSDYYGMFGLFNQLSEPGNVDKRFGKKSYSDSYDSLYMVESPFITLPTPEQSEKLKAAEAFTKTQESLFSPNLTDFHSRFKTWVEEMRSDPKLIEERLKAELDRRAVSTAKLDNYKDGNTKRLLDQFVKLPGNEEAAEYKKHLDTARTEEDAIRATIPHVMVMRDNKKRETHILKRGNYETLGDVVQPGVPAFLPALPNGSEANRLALANWLTSPEQPLMSRVIVNRFWQLIFGRGLVKTPDDFGLQGALPSHPELLDWLAVEFRESGWDIKRLLRLLVTTQTYQQSALATIESRTKDPENVLLSRGPRFRLDSRIIRDQALAISGLLVEKIGGQPVSPYQPDGIVEEMSFGKNRYFQGHGNDLYRRSLYTFWRRSVAPANFFDVPARQSCVVKPYRTNTPLHTLTTLNDPTYVEAARAWAEKLLKLEGDQSRIQSAIYTATARHPDEREKTSLLRILEKTRQHFSSNQEDAKRLLSTGESPRSNTLEPSEHAAWTTLCLLILNLDETLTR
ncbi:MAG: PSD1 and planctomycete cytochrome C domain-containing protein [Verrucomicrobiota bacterium]